MADNGNNDRLRASMNSTAALAVARFVVPILMTLVGAAGSVILYGVWESIQEVKANQTSAISQLWQGMSKLNDRESAAERELDTADTTMADHIRTENDIDNQLRALAQDHENRIRTLEHGR